MHRYHYWNSLNKRYLANITIQVTLHVFEWGFLYNQDLSKFYNI
jgi:hypothetical protein